MAGRRYVETFDGGPGGWLGCKGNGLDGVVAPEVKDGALVSRSPWWIDYNHAPPGGGYLNLFFGLLTTREGYGPHAAKAGANRFVEGGYPLDWTNARITVRIKGDLHLRGTKVQLLAQAQVGDKWVNCVLTGQPLVVAPNWTEQTIRLVPDPDQWQCIGSHVSRMDRYGWGEAAEVLRDLNGDIIFVLFPVDVVPAEPVEGNPHHLRAGEDYAVDTSRLPEGYVMMDTIQIEFAEG
jgi:hypothetical protein